MGKAAKSVRSEKKVRLRRNVLRMIECIKISPEALNKYWKRKIWNCAEEDSLVVWGWKEDFAACLERVRRTIQELDW